MDEAREILSSLRRAVEGIEIGDILEILIITYLVYHIVLWMKTTRAWVLLKGLIVLAVFWAIAFVFKMHTILWLGENILGFAVTAILIVLQPELRKALEELGKTSLVSVLPFDSPNRESGMITERTVSEITKACVEMSKVKTGALIVIEREQSLVDYERTGIDVDAILSSQLLINIFEHNTPLHDGAVIVRGNRVTSATCYLPLTDRSNISKELGTRHRAGVGISEVADSITVIVSEQTGKISVAVDGDLERNFDGEKLKNRLLELVNIGEKENKKQKKKIRKGKGKA
ncbi:MAG: diadenylate cyclase CdaA [Lachnospiraceae bacterium]|nr:diadenylate cyclase CdaA [Lachnospiraceae bacterium]